MDPILKIVDKIQDIISIGFEKMEWVGRPYTKQKYNHLIKEMSWNKIALFQNGSNRI